MAQGSYVPEQQNIYRNDIGSSKIQQPGMNFGTQSNQIVHGQL